MAAMCGVASARHHSCRAMGGQGATEEGEGRGQANASPPMAPCSTDWVRVLGQRRVHDGVQGVHDVMAGEQQRASSRGRGAGVGSTLLTTQSQWGEIASYRMRGGSSGEKEGDRRGDGDDEGGIGNGRRAMRGGPRRGREGVGRALVMLLAVGVVLQGAAAEGWAAGRDGQSLWEKGWEIYGEETQPQSRRAFDEYQRNAIGTTPKVCKGTKYCSRCDNTTALWYNTAVDPNWITFKQIFNSTGAPADLFPKDGQPITKVNGQNFENNQYHYFEFVVGNGDREYSDDTRRDVVYFTLTSPDTIQVSNGRVVPNSADAAKNPAWDFFVGQNCIPQEGNWNNQGYGNLNANELVKSVVVNVTKDARYFIALQSRKLRYGVVTYDASMKLSRGMLESRWESTKCVPLQYRYPDEIASMQKEYRQTGVISAKAGGPVPMCGETPRSLKYNVQYLYPTPNPKMSDKDIAIVVGAVCGAVVFMSFAAGAWLFVRYKRTTKRMAKFSSLSRGLPDALMDGEGQEVAV